MAVTLPRAVGVPLKETRAGTIISIIISLISMAALSICLSRRVQDVRLWAKLPLVCWLVLLINTDSIFFVAGTAVLSNGFGVDSSKDMCARAIILCLACYMTTKLIYYFLVERAYIIRKTAKSRLKSRLYLFNSFGMLIPYCVVIVLNFYFRFAVFENGSCQIGMKRVAMIPLIAFDILVNVYLTSLFLLPLRSLYSYRTNPSSQTRTVALRTFVGSCCTLASSVVNLTVLLVLNGEPGWICLMCCNIDILFSVLILHWITSKDNASTLTQTPTPQSRPQSHKPRPHSQLHAHSKSHSQVTTLVTASHALDTDPDLIYPFPANAITVSRDLVRAVDDIGGGEGRGAGSGGVGGLRGRDGQRNGERDGGREKEKKENENQKEKEKEKEGSENSSSDEIHRKGSEDE